ncbi:hypothetical protein FV139_16500 [Parahaliea maris]|uniref:Uncharacterized protein n=1 Tax=Parahaliea maris TaxID=2716870 RepID=A0A5C8ZVP5_9GAMM|nr:hypothetical protein [Parahaliea maris]TXS91331.1 hypothetical protein FV139_16500 [Parahaliea maris]
MKASFKPLGLAAAVAAATAGYTGAANATVAANQLGDLALVPYYTVQNGFVTGVHIINTSEATQVVKLRMRRASDSMDALDFNLIMSPKDEWTGWIDISDSGEIAFNTGDNTCTAPQLTNGRFVMPDDMSDTTLVDFRTGAEEGYIEVIGMGQPDSESAPIAVAAKHGSDGVPADCNAVASNFYRATSFATATGVITATPTENGVQSPILTHQCKADAVTGLAPENCSGAASVVPNNYVDSENALKVSYFIRDTAGGLEMGSNAVHIEDFSASTADAMITNQQTQLAGSFDPMGYLFPDLDGGSPFVDTAGNTNVTTVNRGLFDTVIRPDLGALEIVNDWSTNPANNVRTDWVVTFPGQYTMLNIFSYIAALPDVTVTTDGTGTCTFANTCDLRDIPVDVSLTVYDREEQSFTPAEGGLVVSPSISATPEGFILPNEVNVIEWASVGVTPEPVLGSDYAVTNTVQLADAVAGWAELDVKADPTKGGAQSVFEYMIDPNLPGAALGPVAVTSVEQVPMIGFTAWERSFPSNPDANYGRIIDHSFVVSS